MKIERQDIPNWERPTGMGLGIKLPTDCQRFLKGIFKQKEKAGNGFALLQNIMAQHNMVWHCGRNRQSLRLRGRRWQQIKRVIK